MTILQANLKHLYQRRGLWFWYLVMLSQFPLVIMPFNQAKNNNYFHYLILSIYAGMAITGIQNEILSKPFSFCLPGHRAIPRRVIFGFGTIFNGLLGLIFLAHPDVIFPHSLLVAIAFGFTGMSIYLYTSICPPPGTGQWRKYVVILLASLTVIIYFRLDKILMTLSFDHPLIVIAVNLAICSLIWHHMGRNDLARKYCGKLIKGPFDGFNAKRVEKLRTNQMIKNTGKKVTNIQNWLEQFFLKRMFQNKFLSPNRYLWGRVYTDLGQLLVFIKPVYLLFSLPVILLSGYSFIDYGIMSRVVVLIPCAFAFTLKFPSFPSLLLPGGRREIFYGVLASAFSITLIISIILASLVIISHLIKPFLPPINSEDLHLKYQGLNFEIIYSFLMIIPILFSTSTTLKRNHFLRLIIVILSVEAVIFLPVLSKVFQLKREITFTPLLVITMIISFWLIFIAVAHRVCMKRSLVGQNKG